MDTQSLWNAVRGMSPFKIPGAFLETASQLASIGSYILAFGAVPAVAIGVVPRAGPMRAIVLGCKSFIFRPTITRSNRVGDIAEMHKRLLALKNGKYLVTVGGKGVGKSTLIDTVLRGMFGVVTVIVEPGMTSKEIKDAVYSEIVRSNVNFGLWLNLEKSACRVIKWHRRIFFGNPPTVVLMVGERGVGKPTADVPSAVRTLALQGLRVVVDASYNSLDVLALNTDREKAFCVEPMDVDTLLKIEEISDVVAALKDAGQFDLTFAVLGGVPLKWINLAEAWDEAGRSDVVGVATACCEDALGLASRHIIAARIAEPRVKKLYDMFKSEDRVQFHVLEELGIVDRQAKPSASDPPPSPEKVLRIVHVPGIREHVLVPTTPAARLVLRYGENGLPPTLDTIRKALSEEKTSSATCAAQMA